jgi:hypothetical protein
MIFSPFLMIISFEILLLGARIGKFLQETEN